MIAKIKINDTGSYDSVVFLADFCGWESRVLVFDEKQNKLITREIYNIGNNGAISQNLVIINWDSDGMIQIENQYCYEFIKEYANCPEQVPEEILCKCREMQNGLHIKQWYEIINEQSKTNLLNVAGYFHDGVISNVEKTEKYIIISIAIWGGQIHLKLKNPVFSENFIEELSNSGYMYDSNIFFENDRIYFVDAYHIKSCEAINDKCNWFYCDKMEWKITLGGGAV